MMDRQELREKFVLQIQAAISDRQFENAINIFRDLHPGDQVEVFDMLETDERNEILSRLDILETAQLFTLQEDNETLEAAEGLSIERLADVLDEMAPDEAADLLLDLPPDQAAEALEQMEDLEDVLPLLEYPDETAGGRMTTEFLSISQNATTAEVIDTLREIHPDSGVPFFIFVIDKNKKLVGITGLRELVVSSAQTQIMNIMDPEVISVDTWLDQEEVAQIMVEYDLSTLPVINEMKQLVGVITHDDILDVIQEEATEDIYRLASVSDFELEPNSSIRDQLRGRLPWLFLNTLTALFASWVISNFEIIIAQVAVLAVFQSVVAGQGGNAASQSVAMFVRATALGNIPRGQTLPLLFRQMAVGLFQGLVIGLVVGVGVTIWKGNPYLGLVLGLALVGNMILAGIVGTLAPLGLKAIGQDPAMASSVLVTAATDSLGFFIFLSLAKFFFADLI
ncbi:MAG: magnesium transporter [Anaerolineales bacterium]|jgi:magnesium transporter